MTIVRVLTLVLLAVVFSAPNVVAQSLSRYRAYALESSPTSIVKASGAREADLKTLHDRPARIQELEWRAAYVSPGKAVPDPVRSILFTFFDDQLYRMVVTYDHDRMEGLTDSDVLESVSAAYAALPMQAQANTTVSLDMPANTTVVAQWDDGSSMLSLVRAGYSREFQLILISKPLSARARTAAREALRLDTKEAPQRELDQRNKALADIRVAQEKARTVNKAAFKP
jgi:hypothetical protein